MKIKKLSACTLNEITKVWNEAFSGYSVNMQVSVDQIALMIGRKELLPSASVVAFIDGNPAGFVLNAIKTINGVKTAWNGGTGVSPSHQGRGIGKIVMEAAVEEYRKQEVKLATLEVLTSNKPGIALYERLGYEIFMTTRTYTLDGEIKRKNSEKSNYILKHGLAADVMLLPFYNKEVTYESMPENIFNGESIILLNQNGTAAGYALFRKYKTPAGTGGIMLFQCEVSPEVSDQDEETVIRTLLSNVFDCHETSFSGGTGDFVSKSRRVSFVLEDMGFKQTAERYKMNLLF